MLCDALVKGDDALKLGLHHREAEHLGAEPLQQLLYIAYRPCHMRVRVC